MDRRSKHLSGEDLGVILAGHGPDNMGSKIGRRLGGAQNMIGGGD